MKTAIFIGLTLTTLLAGSNAYARLPFTVSADSNVQYTEQLGGSMTARATSQCTGGDTVCQTAVGGNVRQTIGNRSGGMIDAKSTVQISKQLGGSAEFNAINRSTSGAKSQAAAAYNVEQTVNQ